jgi:hypothetical protein
MRISSVPSPLQTFIGAVSPHLLSCVGPTGTSWALVHACRQHCLEWQVQQLCVAVRLHVGGTILHVQFVGAHACCNTALHSLQL